MVTRTRGAVIQDLEEGNLFYVTERVTVPSGGGTKEVVLDVPSSTDTKAQVINLTFRTESALNVDFFENVDIGSQGSDLYVTNAKTGVGVSEDANYLQGGSYSGGTQVASSFVPGGRGNQATGSSSEDIRLLVSNGDNLMLRFTNNENSDARLGVVLLVAEQEQV